MARRVTRMSNLPPRKGYLPTGFLPPLRFCLWTVSWTTTSPSGSGVDRDELHDPSIVLFGSDFVVTSSILTPFLDPLWSMGTDLIW